MDQADLTPLLEDLSDQITQLESALSPIANSLSLISSKLPLLEKAKLTVLTTYAIESVLFSYVRLNGQDAKSHPVFTELTRVKQYFAKIKAAEEKASGTDQPTTRIDKGAAGRFIKHGLAGNERYDRERRERQDAERERARTRAEEIGQRTEGRESAPEPVRAEEFEQDNEQDARLTGFEETENEKHRKRKRVDDKTTEQEAAPSSTPDKKSKRSRKNKKSETEEMEGDTIAVATPHPNEETAPPRKRKTQPAPRSAHDTFQALLQGPISKAERPRNPRMETKEKAVRKAKRAE